MFVKWHTAEGGRTQKAAHHNFTSLHYQASLEMLIKTSGGRGAC